MTPDTTVPCRYPQQTCNQVSDRNKNDLKKKEKEKVPQRSVHSLPKECFLNDVHEGNQNHQLIVMKVNGWVALWIHFDLLNVC